MLSKRNRVLCHLIFRLVLELTKFFFLITLLSISTNLGYIYLSSQMPSKRKRVAGTPEPSKRRATNTCESCQTSGTLRSCPLRFCRLCCLHECNSCFGEEEICRACWDFLDLEDQEDLLEQSVNSRGYVHEQELEDSPWLQFACMDHSERACRLSGIPYRTVQTGTTRGRPDLWGVAVVLTSFKALKITREKIYDRIRLKARQEAIRKENFKSLWIETERVYRTPNPSKALPGFLLLSLLPEDLVFSKIVQEHLDEFDVLSLRQTSHSWNTGFLTTLTLKKDPWSQWMSRQLYFWRNFTQQELFDKFGDVINENWFQITRMEDSAVLSFSACHIWSNWEEKYNTKSNLRSFPAVHEIVSTRDNNLTPDGSDYLCSDDCDCRCCPRKVCNFWNRDWIKAYEEEDSEYWSSQTEQESDSSSHSQLL